MKLIELKKEGDKKVWVQLSQISSFREAGRDLIVSCVGSTDYRIIEAGPDVRKLIKDSTVIKCQASIE